MRRATANSNSCLQKNCRRAYWSISPSTSLQFTVEVCAAGEICRKIAKTLCFEGSRSF